MLKRTPAPYELWGRGTHLEVITCTFLQDLVLYLIRHGVTSNLRISTNITNRDPARATACNNPPRGCDTWRRITLEP